MIAMIAVAALCLGTALFAIYDHSDGQEETYEYSVTNKFASDFTIYLQVDGAEEYVEARYNATATITLPMGSHNVKTYCKIGEEYVLLDDRTRTFTEDVTCNAVKVTVNKGSMFTEEVLNHFTFELSKLNSYCSIASGITGFTEKTEYTATTAEPKKIQSFLSYSSDTVTGIMLAETDYEDYASNAIAVTLSGTATSGSLSLNVNAAQERTFKVFEGAELKIGIKLAHFRDFIYLEPLSTVSNNDGTVNVVFRLGNGQQYALSATDDVLAHLGFAADLKFNTDDTKNPKIVDLTQEGYMVSEGKNSGTIIPLEDVS